MRDLHQEGILYFSQGIIACFIFVITYGVLVSTAINVFAVVVPEFRETYIKEALALAKGMPKEVIEQIGKDVYEA